MTENKAIKNRHRIGSMSATVFEKQITKQGRTIAQHSIAVQKSRKDRDTGEWINNEIWLFPSEIAALVTVAQQAYQDCVLKSE